VLLHNGGSAREDFLEQVALTVLDILDGGPGELPRLDLLGPLAGTYLTCPESLLDHYRVLKERHSDIYDFGPEQLSNVGRLLVERVGDRSTAAAVFRLNVEEHPGSAPARRDLGNFLFEEGQPAQALPHLLRARELSTEPDPELEATIAEVNSAVLR